MQLFLHFLFLLHLGSYLLFVLLFVGALVLRLVAFSLFGPLAVGLLILVLLVVGSFGELLALGPCLSG